MRTAITKQDGYIVLLSVILLSVIGVTVAVTLLLIGLSHSQGSFTLEQSIEARALAQGCGEHALDALRQDLNYAGNETIAINTDDCTIRPLIFNDPIYTIETQATIGNNVKKIKIETQSATTSTPAQLQIISWQEVADF